MTDDFKLIAKVFKNQKANQKLVTIPKSCDIDDGDFITFRKVNFQIIKKNEKNKDK